MGWETFWTKAGELLEILSNRLASAKLSEPSLCACGHFINEEFDTYPPDLIVAYDGGDVVYLWYAWCHKGNWVNAAVRHRPSLMQHGAPQAVDLLCVPGLFGNIRP
jgi:hypothetical protein